MRKVMSTLVVLTMAFALVSSSAAGGNVSAKDADNPGHFFTGTPYPCGIESPAYTDYIDARPAPCDRDQNVSAKDADKNHLSTGKNPSALKRTPEPMGSPRF